jgi:hypothetical protein
MAILQPLSCCKQLRSAQNCRTANFSFASVRQSDRETLHGLSHVRTCALQQPVINRINLRALDFQRYPEGFFNTERGCPTAKVGAATFSALPPFSLLGSIQLSSVQFENVLHANKMAPCWSSVGHLPPKIP